jgi:hypothetical protein
METIPPPDHRSICRVCGHNIAPDAFYNEYGDAEFIICDCCGCESGYQDATMQGIRTHRAAWLARVEASQHISTQKTDSAIPEGLRNHRATFLRDTSWRYLKSKPENWDIEQQMAQIPQEYR